MWAYTHKNEKGGGEKWGFVKKAKVSEIVTQESESTEKKRLYQEVEKEVETSQEEKGNESVKKERASQVITNKSDIMVSFDEEYLTPVISQKKTHDFRS